MAVPSPALRRGRTGIALVGAILGLLLSGVGGVGPAAAPAATAAVTVSANVTVGLPSWWGGSNCDAVRWNRLAPSYGWTIDATHPGSHPLGASYLGVPVCGPRPGIDGSPDILWARSGWGESEWECVELAQRFMAQFYGVSAYGADGGYVVANYRPAYGGGLITIKNGTVGIAPTPGDVMSFTTPVNPWGHVTVVTGSTVDGNGNGSITMLSQNDTSNGWRTLQVVNWRVQGFNTFVATAWLHDPAGRANPLADGTFVRVSGQTAVYRLAGGAPIPVTDWSQFGGVQPVTVIAAAQFNRFNAYPSNGTYLEDALTGQAYRVAGGSPETIGAADATKLPGWGKAPVIAVDHNAIMNNEHLRAYPADGTLVCNVSDLSCYQIAGGAPLYVPATDTSKIAGWSTRATTLISGDEFSAYTHLRPTPADGTFLCDVTTSNCYETAGGAPLLVAPGEAARLPGWSSTAVVKTVHWEFANYAHLRPVPADGTYVCDVADANCYVIAGGAPIYVTPAVAPRLPAWSSSGVVTTSSAEFTTYTHLRRRPADGTLIEGSQTGTTYQVDGGIARQVLATAALAAAPRVVVDQSAVDNAGLAGRWSHLVSAPPAVGFTSPSVIQTARTWILVSWAKPVASSAVTGYDLRLKTASFNSGFGPWTYPTVWQNLTVTHVWDRAAPGTDTCFQLRAHNRAGQIGPWSAARCIANALDDRYPGASAPGMRAISSTTAYYGTLTWTATHGAAWRLPYVQLDRIGVVAKTCPTCGSLTVLVNNVRIGVISLVTSTVQESAVVGLPHFAYRTGTLTLLVTSPSGRRVQLDGILVSRT